MTTHDFLLQKYGTTLSFEQAASELRLHPQTIRMMCQRGDIKTSRAGKKWVLTTKAIAEFLDSPSCGKAEPLRSLADRKKAVQKRRLDIDLKGIY